LLDLQQKLQGMLTVPAALFDPFAPVDRPALPVSGRSGFSGALGLIYLQAAVQDLPINFVRPRQPVVAKNPKRRLYVLAACLAGLIVIGGTAYWYMKSRDLDIALARENSRKKENDQNLLLLDESDRKFKAVEEWTKGEVVWLDELYDMTDRVGDAKEIKIVQILGDPLARNAKSDLVAKMTIKGILKENGIPADHLLTAISDDAFYKVGPKNVILNGGVERNDYKLQFTATAEIKERSSSQFVRRMPDPPPQAAVRSERGGRPGGNRPPGGAPGGNPGGTTEPDPFGGLP